jgi:hypothetical protein
MGPRDPYDISCYNINLDIISLMHKLDSEGPGDPKYRDCDKTTNLFVVYIPILHGVVPHKNKHLCKTPRRHF